MRNLTKILAGAMLTLTSSVMAYIPDRCDWQDCDALARGESTSTFAFIITLIILGAIILSSKK